MIFNSYKLLDELDFMTINFETIIVSLAIFQKILPDSSTLEIIFTDPSWDK